MTGRPLRKPEGVWRTLRASCIAKGHLGVSPTKRMDYHRDSEDMSPRALAEEGTVQTEARPLPIRVKFHVRRLGKVVAKVSQRKTLFREMTV